MKIPQIIEKRVSEYSKKLESYPKLQKMYRNCYLHTISTAIEKCDDGTYFVLTGDIPAMWLRDSVAQITHYLPLANDKEVGEMIEGVIRRLFMYIQIDPYANAFNKESNDKGHVTDLPKKNAWVWERKYEIDSLCYPIRLLYLYWKKTGKTEIVKEQLESVAKTILGVWKTEQHHTERSDYYHIREKAPHEALTNGGYGNPVGYTGMVWSGFRPSDDSCEYGYLTASEMFAVVVLGYMAEMLEAVCENNSLAKECIVLRGEIDEGIKKYCVIEHSKYGKIYACETDGLGNYTMIDDANVPSLLSIPYIGYADENDEIYRNTRSFLLSEDNPYYFVGKCAKGIGSRHTPDGYIWHMALVMQGLTSTDNAEKKELIDMIVSTDADTGYLHEGFNADNPYEYTREWFTWPNSLFAEFVEKWIDEGMMSE